MIKNKIPRWVVKGIPNRFTGNPLLPMYIYIVADYIKYITYNKV